MHRQIILSITLTQLRFFRILRFFTRQMEREQELGPLENEEYPDFWGLMTLQPKKIQQTLEGKESSSGRASVF